MQDGIDNHGITLLALVVKTYSELRFRSIAKQQTAISHCLSLLAETPSHCPMHGPVTSINRIPQRISVEVMKTYKYLYRSVKDVTHQQAVADSEEGFLP